jgi:methylmalonyl-CoA/ethylmalonyl-CoA epimerase
MIKGIAHVGIAVADLEKAKDCYEKLCSLKSTEVESFGELKFSFLPLTGTHIELLQSTTPEGVMNKFIDKKGEGIHHISYEVDDIEKEVEVLSGQGVQFVTPKPYPNAHKNLVIFIHPKCTNGVLTELIQFLEKKHQ